MSRLCQLGLRHALSPGLPYMMFYMMRQRRDVFRKLSAEAKLKRA
jgi:hypothetical protein